MVTKCRESRFRDCLPLGLFILTTILVGGVAGCQGRTPTPIAEVKPPVISDPKVGAPTPLKPGQEAGIFIEVSCPTGITLTYTWYADGGEIVRGQESPAITYRAPDTSGTYNVRVVVNWDGHSVEKTTFITVEEGPTPTSTPRPPTEAPSLTPTDTPSPTPETPTALCQSSRPPLDGPPVNVEVQITDPTHCDKGLDTTITASGTYSGDLTGKEIWVLVYPTDLKYYPQSPDACGGIPVNASGGMWNTRVNFGGPPQQYDIVAIVTDTGGEASQEFKRWLQTGCTTENFPGYSAHELPGGITEVDAVTVSTAPQ
jgi:hypothetical protein